MKYDRIIEASLQNLTGLRRVRVKTDPKHLSKEGAPENCPSYEGYVLEEGLTKMRILILPPDLSVEDVPTELIEYISDAEKDDAFCELKSFILNKLNLEENNPIIEQINNSNNIGEIETFLKQSGLDDSQISELYRTFILN